MRWQGWLLVLGVAFGLLFFLSSPSPVHAQCDFGVFEVGFPGIYGANTPGQSVCAFVSFNQEGPWAKVRNAIAYTLITLTIMAGTLGIVIGGYFYMFSLGVGGQVKKAKEWILYALLGISLAVLSWIILYTINPPTVQ